MSEHIVAQWQDSAPDMDYDEWLAAEIGIQVELLEDIPKDDYVGLAGVYTYIVEIQDEIKRRSMSTECVLCNESMCGELSVSLIQQMHRECALRSTMGGIGHLIAHEYWCEQKHDPDAGLTYRQSALLVDEFMVVVGIDETLWRPQA